ncbi:MAG: hypothetical protein HW390_610 [Candidatus Brocadiaceae bacterium]|nr:hypothetical protein [Candidatus Brocadiaceae bacterium]
MRKIIHLTDLHIGFNGLEARFDNIVTNISKRITPAGDYVIVITGDLVEDAKIQGSYEKASPYLDRLKANGFTVLVIPGNHDYGTGTKASREYVTKFKDCFLADFKTWDREYPKLDLIDNVAFIGLDSMEGIVNDEALSMDAKYLAQGQLGDAQLAALDRMLNSEKVQKAAYTVVYLHHHPTYSGIIGDNFKLVDGEQLMAILTAPDHKITALLFGHRHKHGKLTVTGIGRVYNGGTSTFKGNNRSPHHVIDLSEDPKCDREENFCNC